MTGTQPPFSMKSSKGQLIGFEVELAQLLARSMNVKLTIIEMPFHELLPAIESGKVDAVMSGMTITPERNLKAAFVGPYMISGKSILTKSESLAESDETQDIDKSELKLAALKGSTSENFVKYNIKSAQVTLVDKYEEGIKLLISDDVDALIADYPICVLAQLRYPEAGFTSLDAPLTLEPIGMALPTNDALLINLIQNYFNSIALAGILDELQKYWFENGSWIKEVTEIQIKHQTAGPIY